MAGAGYKLFNTGDVLTAAQVNTYLQEQAVMRFANSTARTTALSGVLAEGMMSYLDDTNVVQVYNGSAWVNVGEAGDITEVLAGTGISGGGTSGSVTITNSMATTIDAKGDLIVGTGADTFARLAVGATNGHTLQVDSSTSTGLKWAAASGGSNVKIHNVAVAATTTLSTSTLTDISGYSLTFTPTSATNNIIIFGQISADSTTGDVDRLTIDVGGSNYAISDYEQGSGTNNYGKMIYARLENLAASSQTVKLRGRSSGAALITYYGSTAGYVGSGITVLEIY